MKITSSPRSKQASINRIWSSRTLNGLPGWALFISVLLCSIPALAQGTYLKRVLIYAPSGSNPFGSGKTEVPFINQHSSDPSNPGNPLEFQPVDPTIDNNTAGMSEVWDEYQWVRASVSDFQQFDAIIISDGLVAAAGTSMNANPTLLATRAIWGSAVNGNIFIAGGDPIRDNNITFAPVFRQGTRFAAEQAGNGHGRTGLYVALDHLVTGDQLIDSTGQNSMVAPTDVAVLSWFGSFKSESTVAFNGIPSFGRLICQHPFFNVLGSDVAGYVSQDSDNDPAFISWPAPFAPVALKMNDSTATPTNNPYYFDPVEADTGYEMCSGQSPRAYVLAKAANIAELTRLQAAQPNIACLTNYPVSFSAYSTIVPVSNPAAAGSPNTQISWRVVSGPNAGLSGLCNREWTGGPYPYGFWEGVWDGSYRNQANITAGNSQDVVQLFMDYNANGIFDDFSVPGDQSSTDPNDPAPGVTFDYGTTFTVNWAVLSQPQVSFLSQPGSAVFEGTSANFVLTNTGPTAIRVNFCTGGTAVRDQNYSMPTAVFNGGIGTIEMPASSAVNVPVEVFDDGVAEGPLTIQMSLNDDRVNNSYVVAGNGYGRMTTIDRNQPNAGITANPSSASESQPQTPATWTFNAYASANNNLSVVGSLRVYFTFSGTATRDVDYTTDLVPVTDDTTNIPNIILPDGLARVTLLPVSPGSSQFSATVNLFPLADSRTKGTLVATANMLANPTYRVTTTSSSINILDNNSPQIPPHGYSIIGLIDQGHSSSFAAAVNDSGLVAGGWVPLGSTTGDYNGFLWNIGAGFTTLPTVGSGADIDTRPAAISPAGWEVGYELDKGPQIALNYWLWNGSSILALQTPGTPIVPGYGPSAMNDANFIVGSAEHNVSGLFRATEWNVNGNFTDLGGLATNSTFPNAFAFGLSPSESGNRAAGASQIDLADPNPNPSALTMTYHAFRTQPAASPQVITNTDDMGNALASDTSSSGAYAINGFNELAGYSAYSATEQRAAYKDGYSGKNEGWRILGVLNGGAGSGMSSEATGINNAGLIVGWSRSSNGFHATIWENYDNPAATDLNSLLSAGDQSAWVLQYATGINNSGQIVGYGLKNGNQQAFVLTPNP